MGIHDILLQLRSAPEHSPRWSIDAAISLATTLDARLSGVVCQIVIPRVSNWLADKLVHANALIAEENAKSRESARHLLDEMTTRIPAQSRGEQTLIECTEFAMSRELAKRARSHDITVVPIDDGLDIAYVVQDLVFESGRPIYLMPRSGGGGHRLDIVTVAWDGSRAAARALADALPFCSLAKTVRVAWVSGDNDKTMSGSAADICRNLACHGIEAEAVDIPADGRNAGTALLADCKASGTDLLVMGAYGHSRAREFVLGGATRSVLASPELPIILSH